jgi:hypothetical protein
MHFRSFSLTVCGRTSNYVDVAQSSYLLVNYSACNGLIHETDALVCFRCDKDIYQYLQQQICPAYYELPLDERIIVARSTDFVGSMQAI